MNTLLIISYVLFYINLPVSTPAKELHLSVKKNTALDTEAQPLANHSKPAYDLENIDLDKVRLSGESYILLSSTTTEEIVTQVDSGKVFAFYPAISISVTSDGNQMEAGQKVQRILQELLPLNIF